MNKQLQGSKKKARKKAYLKRQAMKQARIDKAKMITDSIRAGNIDETARLLGIRLK
jgi:hypothetical protein